VHEGGSGLLLLSRNIEDVSQILGGGQDWVSQKIYVQHEQKTRTGSPPLRLHPTVWEDLGEGRAHRITLVIRPHKVGLGPGLVPHGD